jgi:hypothetical protein
MHSNTPQHTMPASSTQSPSGNHTTPPLGQARFTTQAYGATDLVIVRVRTCAVVNNFLLDVLPSAQAGAEMGVLVCLSIGAYDDRMGHVSTSLGSR